jgi:hypothetical protein
LARPSTSRLSAPFAACFLGTDAQETGNAVLTGRLLSQTGSRDVASEKIEAAEQVVGAADFASRRQAQRALFACYANTLVVRKTVAERYKRTCTEKNEKRYLFERNGPKVPCFCEEVSFSKGSPSTISRELKVPLRKNWGKSIDFGPPAGSTAGSASLRGTRGSIGGENGNAEARRARRAKVCARQRSALAPARRAAGSASLRGTRGSIGGGNGNAEAQRARRAKDRVRGGAASRWACRSVGRRPPPVSGLATGRSTSRRGGARSISRVVSARASRLPQPPAGFPIDQPDSAARLRAAGGGGRSIGKEGPPIGGLGSRSVEGRGQGSPRDTSAARIRAS